MAKYVDTLIVGGGQAGLSVSYYLSRQGRNHLVLDQAAQAAEAWHNHRWDSFTLNSPNWTLRLPGVEYQEDDPDGFLPRDAIVKYFEWYLQRHHLPVRYGVRVNAVERYGDIYRVTTDTEVLEASHVVIATGSYQRPKIPAFSAALPGNILQVTTSTYRHPDLLPPGAVLVVGSGQSGSQIAEELLQSGRRVYLCVSSARWVPRRYRSKDIFYWLDKIGFFDRTVDQLPSPAAKFAALPQLSGSDGGHTLNLHLLARQGVKLLGRLQDAREGKLFLAPGLQENLVKGDQYAAEMTHRIDGFIEKTGIDAPAEALPEMQDAYGVTEIQELDLKAAGITSVVWATGFTFDYSLVKLPVFDGDGYPIQTRGVTAYPGLYFVGTVWLTRLKSSLFMGVAEDAAYIAGQIAVRSTTEPELR